MKIQQKSNLSKTILIKLTLTFLILSMLIGIFAGCKKNNNQEVSTTPTLKVIDNLSPELKFNGNEVDILYCGSDAFAETFVMDDPGKDGSIVQESAHQAINYVQSRLNVAISVSQRPYSGWDKRDEDSSFLARIFMTGGEGYDLLFTETALLRAINSGGVDISQLYDLETLHNINLDESWWNQSLRALGNGHTYFACGDSSLKVVGNMNCVYFNQDLLSEYQIEENLYEVVKSGNWTLSKLKEIIAETYFSSDGSGISSPDDYYGVTFKNGNVYQSFCQAFNLNLYEKNAGTNEWHFAGNNLRVNNIMSDLNDFVNHNQNVLPINFENPRSDETWNYASGSAKVSKVFYDGRACFSFGVFGDVSILQNADFQLGMIPYPKYDEEQKDYAGGSYTWQVFSIPTFAEDAEISAAVLEVFTTFFSKEVMPAFYETTIKLRGSDNAEMYEMFDFIRQRISYPFEHFYGIQSDGLSMGTDFVKAFIINDYGDAWGRKCDEGEYKAQETLNKIIKQFRLS